MLVAKQVADLITYSRGFLAFVLVWLGVSQGPEALPLAVWLLIADWTGDAVDGGIARRSRVQYQTWIGEHDLHVDMTVAFGLLLYMLTAGYLTPWTGFAYVLLWGLVFWRLGVQPALGMLSQAPVYAWFIYTAVAEVPLVGRWLLIWIGLAVVATWPRFPRETVPGFLSGVRRTWSALRQREEK